MRVVSIFARRYRPVFASLVRAAGLVLGSLALGPLLLGGCASPGAPSGENDEAARLHALFERDWEQGLRENPLSATSVGRNEYDHLLPSVTEEDEARRAEATQDFLRELEAINRSRLEAADRISYDIFERILHERLEGYEFRGHLIPLLVDWGFHIDFARLPKNMPLNSAKGYEDYIARMRAFPEYTRQHIELLKEGLRIGMTLPRVVLEGYEVTIDSHVVEDPADSLFDAPFQNFPASVPEEAREDLRQKGRAAILESVVPAYREFSEFMTGEYIPGARTTLGASELPRGREYYTQRIRLFTTLDLSAEEIHQRGLEEVSRIRGEMLKVLEEVNFDGDLASFIDFLRTDPRFYAETPEELLREAAYLSKKMDAQLPALFKTLPRMPYGVAPVPDHLAPKYTTGRYIGTFPGSTEPGYYWVNTYALESRPLYVLPALTLHEAVPGHHLQISLAQEIEGLPEFRRHLYVNAFGEGWGLYSEFLGVEAGMYPEPYSRFGRLTYEMWRACRLVVDTGLHAFGWTREQAMDYIASHTALSLHEVMTETDRYISWPGQALAYKMGELKIRELRRRAEEALGPGFDIREFHDAVLRNGAVPLSVLETVIDEHIAERRAAGA